MRRISLSLLALLAGLAGCTGSATLVVNLQLAFAPQPAEALVGNVIPTFSVRLMDTDKQVVVDSSDTVILTIDTNPSGGIAVLGGTTVKDLQNGVAVFDDVTLSAAGQGWVLRVQIILPNVPDALSQPFTIRPLFEVVGFSLLPSSSDVELNTALELTFSGTVAAGSVDTDSIQVTDLTTNVGAPAGGTMLVIGNVVRFEPDLPAQGDLGDSGLLPGTIYSLSVPVLGAAGVKSIQGDELVTPFADAFATLDPSFLPVPGDLADPQNHSQLPLFFTDAEAIQNGTDPCPRAALPAADRDSPQVISTSPVEGAAGVGTVQGSIGPTNYVQLPLLSVTFSEPIGPWAVHATDVLIRNTDTNEVFDVQLALTQTRFFTQLVVTVLDLDSPFATSTVPAGNYALELMSFSDLAGNPLVNSGTCLADGTFALTFSTP